MGGPGLFDCWIFIRTPHRESVVSPKAGLIRTFTMSNTPLKCIMLIIKRIHFGDLLDCPLFAIKTPFHPKSSRCPFSEYLYTKHFPMHALLDPPRRLHPPGKMNRLRGKCTILAGIPGTFPWSGNAKCGERGLWSRYPCRPRGKVNQNRRNSRHFPRRRKWRVRRERPVEPMPLLAKGESEPFSQENPALSQEGETASAAREACGAGALVGRGGK